MNKPRRIFIVGHSGAGKGLLAQEIAKQLNWKFINADLLGAVGQVGRQVSDVIGEDGEARFNQTLTEILNHLITQENIVVTTDANVICDEQARELLNTEFTVHLQVSPAVQIQRLSDYRPLLPVDNFEALLIHAHQQLDPLYEQVASFTLSSDDGNLKGHVQAVIEAAEL